MLLELRVQNLLLVEQAELLLGPGLNVITGETGAGKTMLTHALDLLLGCKPRRDIVRPGSSEAYVEGLFEVPPALLEAVEPEQLRERIDLDDGELLLARRVTAQGRSRAYLQGRSASAADLQTVGSVLLAFYGQHEHRKLTLASAQLDVLDGFCGEAHVATRRAYEREWTRGQALQRELGLLRERAGARERDLDLLDFEIDEIEQAAPSVAEEHQLAEERQRLSSVETLRVAGDTALGALEPSPDGAALGVADGLAAASGELERAGGDDPAMAQLAALSATLVEEVRDLARELGDYTSSLEADPARLAAIDERLEALGRLKRKHGGSIDAVLAHAEHARLERNRLANLADETDRVEQQLTTASAELRRLAKRLTAARREAAARLSGALCAELAELAMPDVLFEVELEPVSGRSPGLDLGAKGAEVVEFSIAPNPGVRAGPLREVASGGELSRVMLALMSVATAASGSPTVVFDEVDAGVGGGTARAVGARLRALATSRQAICITHLPQVASQASQHFRVTKAMPSRRRNAGVETVASTSVERLEGDQIVEELCRMLGADADDRDARRHAERLIEAA